MENKDLNKRLEFVVHVCATQDTGNGCQFMYMHYLSNMSVKRWALFKVYKPNGLSLRVSKVIWAIVTIPPWMEC